MRFKNKVAVITGGAHGIGKEIAEEFAAEGATVHIIDKTPGNWFVGDISNKETLERFAAEVLEKSGHVDFLINNALPLMKGIDECSWEEFSYALAVGVTAPFYLTKLLAPHFANGASVINISSSRDRMSQPQTESYTAAKGGIAIFDRYPQTQFEGLNDGPKIHERSAGKKLPGPLKGYIRRKGDQEIRHYEEATRVAPDLVIKMILPPEVSIQRKPQESLENVTRKHEIIQRLAFPDSEVLTVDATMDYEAELALIHNAIWDIIQKKQAGSARA